MKIKVLIRNYLDEELKAQVASVSGMLEQLTCRFEKQLTTSGTNSKKKSELELCLVEKTDLGTKITILKDALPVEYGCEMRVVSDSIKVEYLWEIQARLEEIEKEQPQKRRHDQEQPQKRN